MNIKLKLFNTLILMLVSGFSLSEQLNVLLDAVPASGWEQLKGTDQWIGFDTCINDGGSGCPYINWEVIKDSVRGDVLQIQHGGGGGFAFLDVATEAPKNLSAYADGDIIFDIKTISGNSSHGFDIECVYPCNAGGIELGQVGEGGWESITISIKDLVENGLNLETINTGIRIIPSRSGATVLLDNVRWVNSVTTDDSDGDGISDESDAFPLDASESVDTDLDGIGNNADDDDDNDGVPDVDDTFPLDATETIDTDGDGIGNNADADNDGDGVSDSSDVWPLDYRYSLDSDSDGMPDAYEDTNALNKYVASDANSDSDNDGLTALQEFSSGTSPISKDTDRDTLPDGWEVANGKDPMLPNYLLSVATNAVCLKNDSKIDCWGGMFDIDERLNEIDEEVIKNSTAFPSSGGNFRCLLSDGEIYCNDERQVISDTLPITSIDLGQNTACGINSAGEIKCSGIDGNITAADTSVIESPLSIALGYQFLCGLTSNEVKCAGSLDGHNMPDLVSPYLIDAGDSGICAVDSLGVKCWGDRFGLKDITAPDITNVTDLSVNSNLGCLIDQSEIRCWGNQNTLEGQESPQVVDPVSIGVGTGFACALGNQGVECWGENQYGALTIPSNLMIDPDGDGYSTQGGSDAFPLDSAEWLDTDSDSIGNNADPDDDNDSVLDADDVFPLDASESTDIDGDGVGDNADAFPDDANEAVDSDLDNVGDNADNCVDVTNTDQLNSDDDLLGNACDEDDDNDGVSDELDALPLDATEQIDTDADGIGNNADDDDDNDGVVDNSDAYPLNSLYSADSDGDGMADAWELLYGLDPNDPSDASSDVDNDGAVALQEFIEGTIPSGSLDIDGNENYDALTDGLLLLRGMFGLDGSALVTGTIASDAAYTESVDIESRIETLGELADIDGNGVIDALTDGLLTLRYLFGLQGDTLINGVVAEDATRKTAEEIEAHLESLMPAL